MVSKFSHWKAKGTAIESRAMEGRGRGMSFTPDDLTKFCPQFEHRHSLLCEKLDLGMPAIQPSQFQTGRFGHDYSMRR